MSKVTDAAAEIADVMAKTMSSVEGRKEGADVAAIATEMGVDTIAYKYGLSSDERKEALIAALGVLKSRLQQEARAGASPSPGKFPFST